MNDTIQLNLISVTSKYTKAYKTPENAINAAEKAAARVHNPGRRQTVRYFIHAFVKDGDLRYTPIFIGQDSVPFAHLGFQIIG